MNKAIVWIAVILGFAFLALAVVYVLLPAGALPAGLPGHVAGSSHTHFKHAIGSIIVALALFAFAWFQSGPKRA
jgi:uncharacterized membrane-anchored protein YitT (DUF2179 family)